MKSKGFPLEYMEVEADHGRMVALGLSNGTVEVEQIFVFKAGDGKYIYSRNAGVGTDGKDVRMAMDFEAPTGSSAEWMNSGNTSRGAFWMKK